MLLGAFIAIFQHEPQGLLAYSTISHLGLITVRAGSHCRGDGRGALSHPQPRDVQGFAVHGRPGTSTTKPHARPARPRGLLPKMPHTGVLAIVASGAMAGVPLLNGFLSKEISSPRRSSSRRPNWWMVGAAVAMGMFGVAYSLRFISISSAGLRRSCRASPTSRRDGCVSRGAAGARLPCRRIIPARSTPILDIRGHRDAGSGHAAIRHRRLARRHLPLMMSIVALLGGVSFYVVQRRHINQRHDERPVINRFNGAQAYETSMAYIHAFGGWLLRPPRHDAPAAAGC